VSNVVAESARVPAELALMAQVQSIIPSNMGLLISDVEVRKVMKLIDESGVVDAVDQWLVEDQRGPGGRPRIIPHRAVLVSLVLSANFFGNTLFSKAFDVLFVHISDEMRHELGLPKPPNSGDYVRRDALYKDILNSFHSMLKPMDPSLLPKNRKIDGDAFRALVAARTAANTAELDVHLDRLRWFINRILQISIAVLPRDIRRKWRGSIAVDGTEIPAFGDPERRASKTDEPGKKFSERTILRSSADPDGGFYKRDGDHNGTEGAEKASKGRFHRTKDVLRWSHEAHLGVMIPENGLHVAGFPNLVAGMDVLDRPGHKPGIHAVNAVSAVAAMSDIDSADKAENFLVGDQLFTNQIAETFQLPVRALGFRLVFDYPDNLVGIQEQAEGMIQVEGRWYCPSMPDPLVNATINYRAGRISDDEYRRLLNARIPHEMRSHGAANDDGVRRFICPADGTSPTMICPKKTTSYRTAKGRELVEVPVEIMTFPPKVCRQATVSIRAEVGAKLEQDLRYKSAPWHDA
jgi:hypothetical protein